MLPCAVENNWHVLSDTTNGMDTRVYFSQQTALNVTSDNLTIYHTHSTHTTLSITVLDIHCKGLVIFNVQLLKKNVLSFILSIQVGRVKNACEFKMKLKFFYCGLKFQNSHF